MNTAAHPGKLARLVARLGVLRALLLGSAALVIAATPFADGTVYIHDWRLVPSVIAPSIMMMLVFAIPLDVTMAFVFRADADNQERLRLDSVIRIEVVTYVAMLLAWTPFMIKIVDFTPLQ